MNEDKTWASASFRVFSDVLSPEEIAAALGLRPDRFYKIGDPVSRQGARPVRTTNAFFLESGIPDNEPLQRQIETLVAKIESLSDGLRQIGGQVKADIFCGFSSGSGQGGFTLEPGLLSRLAALQLDVVVDLYPP